MTIPHVLVATTSNDIAHSLESRLSRKCLELGLILQVGPQSDQKNFDSSEHLFFELSNWNPAELLDTLIFLHIGPDLEECFESKVLLQNSPWHVSGKSKVGIALELVLRYPQVYPVFLSSLVPPMDKSLAGEDWNEFQGWLAGWINDLEAATDIHMLPSWERIHFASIINESKELDIILKRFANGFRSIFDPVGFRTLLRNRFLAQVFGAPTRDWNDGNGWENTTLVRSQLNKRLHNFSVVLEEEADLTLLTGYALYKFGYRSWMINSYSEFINSGPPDWAQAKNLLLTRDVDLRLPDIPSNNLDSSIRLQLRDIYSARWVKRLGNNANVKVRVLTQDPNVISDSKLSYVDHTKGKCKVAKHIKTFRGGSSPEDSYMNKAININNYIRRLGQTCDCQGTSKFIGLNKPLQSIYAVTELISSRGGEYHSLISNLAQVENPSKQFPHGAPYLNLMMATDLIYQSGKCQDHKDTRSLIVAAFLAQEAYSLLLGMSRSTALTALHEIHIAEAKIESSSAGMTYSVSIKDRRNDLIQTVNNVCPGDAGSNFLAKLWADLRLVYKDGEQFEASERSNIESLVNAYWFTSSHSQHRLQKPWVRKTIHFIKRVALQPLYSFLYLLAFWLAWSLILTILYCVSQSSWRFSLTSTGALNFIDVYVRMVVSIGRAEHIIDEDLNNVGSSGLLYILSRITDVLCAITSVLVIGLVVSVIFRKSTRG